jgi:NAD(P)-dependent dehydrogenase (short-subunit alcohol dehydrogenase family)
VVGGSRGIGAAVAALLAQHGAGEPITRRHQIRGVHASGNCSVHCTAGWCSPRTCRSR